MIRERVIAIFSGLMIFTLVMFFIQLNTEKAFTGSIINEFKSNINNNSLNDEGLSLKIEKYSFKNGQLDFTYGVQEKTGENHNLEVTYFIHDEAAKVFKSGKENVFLEKDKIMNYRMIVPFQDIGESNLYLTILASDEQFEGRARVNLDLPRASISGNVVKNEKNIALNYFGVLLLVLVVVFYCVKAVYSNNIRKKFKRSEEDRFIPVHH